MKYPGSLTRCRRCPRLNEHRNALRRQLPDYWNKPVPATGDPATGLMIVGLAPGRHGANRTGVPFTGDAAGELLFRTLAAFGLNGRVVITNAVKCLPVDNRPIAAEIVNCQPYLRREIAELFDRAGIPVILALGTIAHKAVLRAFDLPAAAHPFRHGASYALEPRGYLVDSYHCSRYNTQTGRLTPAMFHAAVEQGARLAGLIG